MADSKDDELAKKIQAEMELQAEEKIKFDEKFYDEAERIAKEKLKKEEEEEASISVEELLNLPMKPWWFFRLSRAKNEHFFVKFLYSVVVLLLCGGVILLMLYKYNGGFKNYINESQIVLPKKEIKLLETK